MKGDKGVNSGQVGAGENSSEGVRKTTEFQET